MKKLTLKDGDDLEKRYAQQIIEKVPAYELIWSNFIGNNGLNEFLPLVNFPEGKNEFRKRFSEHHYTIIQSVLCLKVIKEDIILLDDSNLDFVLRLQNQILSLYAHIGRIYDNLLQLTYYTCLITDKISSKLTFDEIAHDKKVRPYVSKLEEFYYQRHIVLHGKQVPIGYDKIGNIYFPMLKTNKNSPKGYDKTMTWTDAEITTPLIESITEIESNLPNCVNEILHNLFNELKTYLTHNKISFVFPVKEATSTGVNVYNIQGHKTWNEQINYSSSIEPQTGSSKIDSEK